jgi:hypothetical protein
MPPMLDLVQDSRLITRFLENGTTVHSFIEPDGARRRIHREEYWKREQRVGSGGFGQVQLEKCTEGKKRGNMRVVKIIDKQSNSPKPIDFNRELEAIAKFSHDRVR